MLNFELSDFRPVAGKLQDELSFEINGVPTGNCTTTLNSINSLSDSRYLSEVCPQLSFHVHFKYKTLLDTFAQCGLQESCRENLSISSNYISEYSRSSLIISRHHNKAKTCLRDAVWDQLGLQSRGAWFDSRASRHIAYNNRSNINQSLCGGVDAKAIPKSEAYTLAIGEGHAFWQGLNLTGLRDGEQNEIAGIKPGPHSPYCEVAQLIEQATVNRRVAGLSPAFAAKKSNLVKFKQIYSIQLKGNHEGQH